MSIRVTRDLKATAHHEAGHAVVSWWLGVKFKHVTVAQETDTLGHLQPAQPPKWFQPDLDDSDRVRFRVERDIIISYAGQLAEAKFLSKHPRKGVHADNSQAVDMAFYVCGSEKTAEAYLHYCWCVSEELVSVYWDKIKSVAEALLEKTTLRYSDVIETIMPGSAALRVSLTAKRKAAAARWKDKPAAKKAKKKG